MGKQCCKICGNGEKQRRTVAFYIGVNGSRRGALGRKNRCGAATKREVAGVAKPISEEQTRDAEAAVALLHLQNAFRVQLAAHDHVVMQMDAAFGRARASGGVEPESRLVFAG